MKVCAVIVTYGDRAELLKQVVEGCMKNNVDKIIIVDNNAVFFTFDYKKVEIISTGWNLGSAGGYKAGLEAFHKSDCDFVWLLDDDNKPEPGALEALKRNMEVKAEFDGKVYSYYSADLILSSDRGDEQYRSLREYIGNFNFPFLRVKKRGYHQDTLMRVPVAKFGGLFFHKSVLDKHGYPNKKMFLYCDDYDFTSRVENIYIVPQSKVTDLEEAGQKKKDKFRKYYLRRNLTYFKKRFANPILYLFSMAVMSFIFLFQRDTLLNIKAQWHGYRGKLNNYEPSLLKNRIGRLKVYLERGKGHFGTLQVISTILILLGVYKDTGIGKLIFEHSFITLPVIILFFFIFLTWLGRLDYKYRIMDEEHRIQAEYNPVLMQIIENQKKQMEKANGWE